MSKSEPATHESTATNPVHEAVRDTYQPDQLPDWQVYNTVLAEIEATVTRLADREDE